MTEIIDADDDLNENFPKDSDYIECSDGSFKCNLCGKTTGSNLGRGTGKQMIQRHVETHVDVFSHTCSICQKSFKSRHRLLCHSRNIHKSHLNRSYKL